MDRESESSEERAEDKTNDESVQVSVPSGEVKVDPKPETKSLADLFARNKMAISIAGGLVIILAVTSIWWFNGPRKENLYWESLNAQGLDDEFSSKELAVLQGKAFCDKVGLGVTREAFWYQKTAVDFFCPRLSDDVVVVLTEKEKNTNYLAGLRTAGLAGEFSSDAEAITAGNVHCENLLSGAKPQGNEIQQVGMKAFCPEFQSGYRVIQPFLVEGSLTLEDYGRFPSIRTSGLSCEGRGGYSDIRGGMKITITNSAGEKVAETALERGSGFSFFCRFGFSVEILEGEEEYTFSFGRRGEFSYTESELKIPNTVLLTIGN